MQLLCISNYVNFCLDKVWLSVQILWCNIQNMLVHVSLKKKKKMLKCPNDPLLCVIALLHQYQIQSTVY